MSFFRFSANELSDSMNCALTWLIEHGGQVGTKRTLSYEARAFGLRRATSVTDATVDALLRRGLLVEGRNGRIQLDRSAVSVLCQYMQNPHPAGAMRAYAEEEAYAEQERRHGS